MSNLEEHFTRAFNKAVEEAKNMTVEQIVERIKKLENIVVEARAAINAFERCKKNLD